MPDLMKNDFDKICYAAGKSVGRIPLAGDVVTYACSRVEARWRYMELHPLLMLALERQGRSDQLTRHLAEEMVKTADWGARRENFRRWYVEGERLRELPEDPRSIMFGFW